MALDYTTVYPGQLDPGDPIGYPYGEARNITVPGDGTGFPLERDWVNDLLGFEQSLLDAAGIVPSGTPDKVGASDYLDAVGVVIEEHPFQDLTAVNATFSGQATFEEGAKLRFESGGSTSKIDGTFRAGDTNPLNIISGSMRFTGATLECQAIVNFTAASTVTFSNEPAFADGMDVTGLASFHSGAEFTAGTVDFIAQADFNGPVNLNAGATLDDPMTLTGNGHIRVRRVVLPDSDTAFGVSTGDIFVIPNGAVGPRTYTLNATGAGEGSVVEVRCFESTETMTVNGFTMRNAAGFAYNNRWLYDGAGWTHLSQSVVP